MKRRIFPLLLAALLLLLTACGAPAKRKEPTEAAPSWSSRIEGTVEINGASPWTYQLTTRTTERARWDKKDHRIVATCTYQVPHMKITGGLEGGDKNEVHPARAISQRFNDLFEDWLTQRQSNFGEIAAMAEEDYRNRTEDDQWSGSSYCYSDAVTASFWNNGHIACVTMESTSFTGGAHAIDRQEAYTFDLHKGTQVGINDMVQDYNSLRAVVADEILHQTSQQIEEDQASYFSDYEKIIPEWMSRSVIFGPDGLTVMFDVYDIAPYAAGEQAFHIPYDMVEPYLNDYGRELLELA